MATSNSRDVKLTVEAQARGEEAVQKLAAQVRALGKEGKDSAPAFEKLGAELDALAAQARSIETIKRLTTEIQAATAAQENAVRVAALAGAEYADQAAKVDVLRAAQAKAAADVKAAQAALDQSKEALARYRAEADEATKKTSGYAAEIGRLKIATIENASALRGYRDALNDAKAAAAAEVKLEAELNREHERAARAVSGTIQALRERSSALRDAEDAARQAQVQTTDLAEAERALEQAMLDVAGRASKQRSEALREQAEADRLATIAAQGLADLHRRGAEALRAESAAQVEAAQTAKDYAAAQAKAAAEEARVAKLREQAASDRLALLEREAQADAKRRGAQDYQAELAAQADATKVARDYAAAQAEAAEQVRRLAQAEHDKLARSIEYAQFQQRRRGEEQAASELLALQESERFSRAYAAAQAAAAERTRELAAAARAAKQELTDAFSAAGVRSVAAIQTEIAQTTRAVALLEAQFKAGGISAYDLSRATGSAEARLQALRAEMAKLPAAAGVLEQMNASVLSLVNRFGALSAAVATVGFAVKPIFDATTQLDSMRRVLTQIYGSIDAANAQIANVSRVANDAGVSVSETSKAYIKYAAAAKEAGLSTRVVNDVFESTVRAAGNLGLSGDEVGRILTALGQIASKGKVSMEELSQQLGDSLPGALAQLAKGLGITQPELIKLVESGQLLAEQALPALGKALVGLGGNDKQISGLAQSFARLQNAVTETYRGLADTSAYKLLTAAVDGAAANFGKLTTAATVLLEVLAIRKIAAVVSNFAALRTATAEVKVATDAATASTVAGTAATVANTAATTANAAAKTGVATATTAVAASAAGAVAGVGLLSRAMGVASAAGSSLLAMLGGLPGVALLVALNARELGTVLGEGVARMLGYGDATDKTRKALTAAEEAVKATARAQEQQGESLVRASVAYANLLEPIKANISAAEKLAKAKEDEGRARQRSAELAGDEVGKLLEATRATSESVTASQAIVAAREQELGAISTLIKAYEDTREAKGRLTDAEQKQLATLVERQKVIDAEVEQAKAKLEVDKAEAAQAKVNAEIFQDNADKLTALAKAYGEAASNAAELQSQQFRGYVTQQTVNRSLQEAAVAQRLFRDALADTLARTEYGIRLNQATVDIAVARLRLGKEEAASIERRAALIGDETGQIQAQIKQRQADLAIAQAQAAQEKYDAEAKINSIRLEREQLEAKGLLTAERRKELEVAQLGAEAKRIEAQASSVATQAIRDQIKALEDLRAQRVLNNEYEAGAHGSGSAANLGGSSANRNAGVNSIYDPASGRYDAAGFATDPAGGRITGSDQLTPPSAPGNWQFVSDVRVGTTSVSFTRPDGSRGTGIGVPGRGYWYDASGQYGLMTARTPATGGGGGGSVATGGGSSVAPSVSPSSATTRHEITLNLGGATTTFDVSSAAQAESVKSFFQSLSTAAARASA